MTEIAVRSSDDIEKTRAHIQKLIDRDRGKSRMSVRGVIGALRSLIQPPTGGSQPLNPRELLRK